MWKYSRHWTVSTISHIPTCHHPKNSNFDLKKNWLLQTKLSGASQQLSRFPLTALLWTAVDDCPHTRWSEMQLGANDIPKITLSLFWEVPVCLRLRQHLLVAVLIYALKPRSFRRFYKIPLLQTFSTLNLLKPTGYVIEPTGLTIKNFTFRHTVFVCFVFISEQITSFVLYNANWLVFITEMKSVYCAVRIGSLNKAVCASSLKG
jgi:hypothetical protein